MQVDVGEVDQILQLRAFTQHHHQLTEAVQLPKIQGDTCSDTRPLTFSIDCQHRAFTSTCVCVRACVHAAVGVLCQSVVCLAVVSEVQVMFEYPRPQRRLNTDIRSVYAPTACRHAAVRPPRLT